MIIGSILLFFIGIIFVLSLYSPIPLIWMIIAVKSYPFECYPLSMFIFNLLYMSMSIQTNCCIYLVFVMSPYNQNKILFHLSSCLKQKPSKLIRLYLIFKTFKLKHLNKSTASLISTERNRGTSEEIGRLYEVLLVILVDSSSFD